MKTTESYESSGEIRALIDDLFRLRPGLYWLDLLLCLGVGWGCFAWASRQPSSFWGWRGGFLLISTFVLFRALIFIHEMVHWRPGDMPGFRWIWNVFCGMPFFLPDYIYLPHYYHHRMATYSTAEDPEYWPLAAHSTWEILSAFLVFPFIPVIFGVRFLLAGPLSLMIGGRLRKWILCHVSTLKMNPFYRWENISAADQRTAAIQDVLCWGIWISILAVLGVSGRWDILLNWYVVIYLLLSINHLRSFARHRYTNVTGAAVSYENQLLDSVTISGFSPLASLFMPIGLRWHSIHHMFPTLPYVALPEAHKRLAAKLPPHHLYFKTLVPDFITAQANIFRKPKAL